MNQDEKAGEMATSPPDLTTAEEEGSKTARLEVRPTPAQKSILEKAASLVGESVTSFVLTTALRDAVKIIHDNQVTELSLSDWARFEAILEEAAEPSAHLKEAIRRHKSHVAREDGL